MTILTRHERERLVLDLYNQGKTYREISKEARISPRDIGVILNKVIEGKKTKGSKEEEQDNNDAMKNEKQEQQLSLSTQAYKLFSEGKTPLEVSITLNLRESEATEFYKEYWKLKQLHNLNMVYEETKGDIELFLKLYRLSKVKGMNARHVINLLGIANNDLPAIEERFEGLRNDVSLLQFQKHTRERSLYQLNNQIATTSRLLNSLRMSCERETREIEYLCNEKTRHEALITEFKSNIEEYLKIKQAAEENVKIVLTNGKLLLQFAIASIIESLRRNPELCDFALSDDLYAAFILEEAEKLYNNLTIRLTNDSIAAATAAMKTISLPLPLSLPSANNNNQKLNYENDTYQTEERIKHRMID